MTHKMTVIRVTTLYPIHDHSTLIKERQKYRPNPEVMSDLVLSSYAKILLETGLLYQSKHFGLSLTDNEHVEVGTFS